MEKELGRILENRQGGDEVYFGMSPENFKRAVLLSEKILESDPIPKPDPKLDFGSYDSLSNWFNDQPDKVKAFLVCVTVLSLRNRESILKIVSGWKYYSDMIPNIPDNQITEIASHVKCNPSNDDGQSLANTLSLSEGELRIVAMYIYKNLTSDGERSSNVDRAFEISSDFGSLMGTDKFSDVWVNNPSESKEVRLLSTVMGFMFLRDLNFMVK